MSEVTEEVSDLPGAALVTGASGAIGAAVCRLLGERGSRWVGGRRPVTPVVGEGNPSREPSLLEVDLLDPESARRFVETGAELYGGIHSLIHAAGPVVPQTFLSQVDPRTLREHLEFEAASFFNVLAPSLPYLRESRGSVVAVTTVANRRFPLRDGLSAGPKGAIEGITRAIAAEEGPFGVRANCVGPGILEDGMTQRLVERGDISDEALHKVRDEIPARRLGRADEVAEAVCFLCSPRASYISGQFLDVDGGYSV